MRILLISPAVISALQKTKTILPPLGLLYIAAVLKKGGHDVDLIDMSLGEKEPVFSLYDLVGITSTSAQIGKALAYARMAKEAGKPVAMGGAHPSFMAEELFTTGYVEYVVRGEGEYTFLELANCLEKQGKGLDVSQIRGLSWYDHQQKRTVHNPARSFITDLDCLPLPARELVDMEAYKITSYGGVPATSVLTSRGCPYDCSFCASTQLNGRKWRQRQVGPVVDEVETLVEDYGFGAILFVDDNLTIHGPRANQLCQEIIRRRLPITWWAMASADSLVRKEELIEKMAASGCTEVFIGLETPNQRLLDNYNKRASADVGERATRLLNKHGIGAYGAFILGEPTETEAEIKETIQYAKSLKLEAVQFSLLTPYPGTRLFAQMQEQLVTRDWRKYDGLHVVFQPRFISPGQLHKLLVRAYLSFYFDPRRLLTATTLRDLEKAIAILQVIKTGNSRKELVFTSPFAS